MLLGPFSAFVQYDAVANVYSVQASEGIAKVEVPTYGTVRLTLERGVGITDR